MFANLPERIKVEVDALRVSKLMTHGRDGALLSEGMDRDSALLTLKQQRQTRICASAERPIQEWLGGSILGALSTFPGQMIQRGQNGHFTDGYDDVGPRAVRKCYR